MYLCIGVCVGDDVDIRYIHVEMRMHIYGESFLMAFELIPIYKFTF